MTMHTMPPVSPILALYREHAQIVAALRAPAPSMDEASHDALDARCAEIEVELTALPCVTAADFAAKAVIATARGQICPDWDLDPLLREARTLLA